MKITIEQCSDDFRAHIDGDRGRWAAGKTPYEAIGNLISSHATDFGIMIEFAASTIGVPAMPSHTPESQKADAT